MSSISKEIVTVSIPKGDLENDFTFFEDGKIRHNYDQSVYKRDLETWLSARQISDAEKQKILQVCPPAFKARITAILKK